jgi:predicted aspartyl protease
MGLTHLKIRLRNPTDPSKSKDIPFLIDSGAVYTVIPKKELEHLGIKRDSKREFILSNGNIIERDMGGGIFEYSGRKAYAPVTFGEEGDLPVIGVTALESLGYGLDPLKRKLIELPLTM